MQITLHLGPHHTDADRLMQTLLAYATPLGLAGCAVPSPEAYRQPLRAACAQQGTAGTIRLPGDLVLEDVVRNVILIHEGLLGADLQILRDGRLYLAAPERIGRLMRHVRPGLLLLSMALRHPAAFLAQVRASYGDGPGTGGLAQIDPAELSWVPVVKAIRRAAPDVPLLVWRQEEARFIGRKILLALTGLHPRDLPGIAELAAADLPQSAMPRLRRYLQDHPPANAEQEARILRAFWALFIDPEVMPRPGGREESPADRRYRDDLVEIRRMPGVELITG